MELMLKNIRVAQMLESASRELTPEMRMDEMALSMLGAYVQDVLNASEEMGNPLDLTYGTVDKLPLALAPLIFAGTFLTQLCEAPRGVSLRPRSERARLPDQNDQRGWPDDEARSQCRARVGE